MAWNYSKLPFEPPRAVIDIGIDERYNVEPEPVPEPEPILYVKEQGTILLSVLGFATVMSVALLTALDFESMYVILGVPITITFVLHIVFGFYIWWEDRRAFCVVQDIEMGNTPLIRDFEDENEIWLW
ncbi:hypothetical protein EDC01DRAFT_789553 [Geopyxis carbonaria]|nr:hypothetical protein EDC01DRAFT_789553 [Geopyxis carbonaria]